MSQSVYLPQQSQVFGVLLVQPFMLQLNHSLQAFALVLLLLDLRIALSYLPLDLLDVRRKGLTVVVIVMQVC